MTKTPASNTVKQLPRYPVENSPSGNYSWGGAVGRVEIVYDIVWMGCRRRTPWTELRTPVYSYPIDVFHLSFNFICLLLLYSIYLNGSNTRDGILERHFYSRFLGVYLNLFRLEFLSSFLPSFFLSTNCYWRINSSFLVSQIFCIYLKLV
jgi:hypothetical protein